MFKIKKKTVIGLSTLAGGPMDSYVRPCVSDAISGDPFIRFLKLGKNLHLGETKKCSELIFEKIHFCPSMGD